MGGVGCSLALFFCRTGCSVSRVASLLAFYPPQPAYYAVRENAETGALELWLDPLLQHCLPSLQRQFMEVAFVSTSRRQRVATVLFHRPGARFTIIYSHANATDLGVMLERYAEMSERLGVNVVGYDYTGYGSSSGDVPSEADCYADITAVYHWACKREAHTQIILYGQSVGSGPSVYLAAKLAETAASINKSKAAQGGGGSSFWRRIWESSSSRSSSSNKRRRPSSINGNKKPEAVAVGRVAGMVIQSGVASGLRVMTNNTMSISCLDIFPNVERLRRVRCPVLVVHGTEDQEVPISHGESLQREVPRECRRTPYWVKGRGHNDIGEALEDKPAYYARLRSFLESLPLPPARQGPLTPARMRPAHGAGLGGLKTPRGQRSIRFAPEESEVVVGGGESKREDDQQHPPRESGGTQQQLNGRTVVASRKHKEHQQQRRQHITN